MARFRSAATPETRGAVGPDADRVASSTCRSGPATLFKQLQHITRNR